jgi:hypothetical protein
MTEEDLWCEVARPILFDCIHEIARDRTIEDQIELLKFYSEHRNELTAASMGLRYGPERDGLGYSETIRECMTNGVFPSRLSQEILLSGGRRECPERKATKPTWIYLMKCHRTGRTKIGRSKNPCFRERTLQSENPDVELTHHWQSSKDKEGWLHAAFEEKRYRGEWFDLNESDIATIEELMGVKS